MFGNHQNILTVHLCKLPVYVYNDPHQYTDCPLVYESRYDLNRLVKLDLKKTNLIYNL